MIAENSLFYVMKQIIEQSRESAVRAVEFVRVQMDRQKSAKFAENFENPDYFKSSSEETKPRLTASAMP